MYVVSRTTSLIRNAKVALAFYCLNLILQFFSRKIFLDYLGADLLGLNTTLHNLLQFLNIAESGIGAAVAFTLYRPLSLGNRQEIIDVVSIQGWFYRKVTGLVILGSVLLMLFFPLIFSNSGLPLFYAYGGFIAFLTSTILGYLINYKIIVLVADQKEYKIVFETQTIKVIKVLSQMMLIWAFPNGYISWMVLEIIAAFITSFRLHKRVKIEYPWLKTNISRGGELRQKYPQVLQKTRQLLFHKVATLVLAEATPLIIYAFSSLTIVAIYGNYLIIMAGCVMMVHALSRGVSASVGNLVATRTKEKVKEIYWEFTSFRLFIGALICVNIYFLIDPFMVLWVGDNYVMPRVPVILMLTIYFIQMARSSDVFLAAYGLFQDLWAPVCEVFLNVVLSIIFGYFWGLAGIFVGVLFSQLTIVILWKSYFLYKFAFKCEFREWVRSYLKIVGILLVTFLFSTLVMESILVITITDCLAWITNALTITVLYGGMSFLLLILLIPEFRSVCQKVLRLLKSKNE